jgi:hypothetical protein
MIYSRNTYNTENLRHEDFIHGLGYDTSLYNKIIKIRGIGKSSVDDYYHEDGISIDGTIRVKKEHPLLNKILIDIKDNRELVIESVHRHWHIGYYWIILYRINGTKSHGTCIYKNENCVDSTVLECVYETLLTKKFKDKNLSWVMF